MSAFIAGLIVAGVGALGGLIGSISDADEAKKKAKTEKEYQNDIYKLNKEHAEEEFNEAQKQANRSAEKANLQADFTDKELDIGERTISNDINTAIDNLYLSGASDTYEWNQQAMSAGQSEGSAYASLAGSGVRAGSSLSDAVEMQAATNSELLQFAQDSKRRSNNNSLVNVLNQLAGNEFNIMQNRVGADETRKDALDLVNSYLEGGSNYKLYQNQLDQMKTTHNYNIGQLNKEISDNTFFEGGNGKAWLRMGTNMLTMGAQGFQTGYNLYDTYYKARNYNTELKTNTSKTSSFNPAKTKKYNGGMTLGIY